MARSLNGHRRKCHKVSGLGWVQPKPVGPWPEKKRRGRGSKAKGHKFEADCRRLLERHWQEADIMSGQWFKFGDDTGEHWAQPDYYIVLETEILLFECKLTQTSDAWRQLEHLYKPLLEFYYELPVVCVQLCRNLLEDDGTIISRAGDIEDGATWYWLGR